MKRFIQKLGPGLLFAGAAIGVSHLVQSTRAGADFGFGLLWALLLIHLVKYPFFQYGPRYASATGESLLEGYRKLGKGVLILYGLLTSLTMFTIQAAVTIVTAGIATSLFGDFISVKVWTVVILSVCFIILNIGKYRFLDVMMKVIIITLTLTTLVATAMAIYNSSEAVSFTQLLPEGSIEITFLIAFMGWMPAPLDISVWHSLWTTEKQKTSTEKRHPKTALLDFNIGYLGTILLGVSFVALGALVMHPTGNSFSNSAGTFSVQLIDMYTQSLGNWAYVIIGIAAFTTMFSTTLTTLDASPRSMHKTTELVFEKSFKNGYLIWSVVLILGTLSIYFFFLSEMGSLIKVATVLSFLTAPFYALTNYILISSKHTPKEWRPSKILHIMSCFGILFLIGFSVWYLTIL
ncbi:iron transporter [Formosa sp. Hel1_33_131]|uniref:NRAMP family divalent metal transporter n=1 Tax=Formosa sp. Hel1_33_131 TaxID=1336794 RepID=UPI00084E1F1F|nr:divalent metal cation transporter [Formosa sp. Hel1_33_131]AOR27634.1 iron transporter [Formosa sp. Hel1_33_131]